MLDRKKSAMILLFCLVDASFHFVSRLVECKFSNPDYNMWEQIYVSISTPLVIAVVFIFFAARHNRNSLTKKG